MMKGGFLMGSVGTTPTIILPANPHRRTLMIGCPGQGSAGSFSFVDGTVSGAGLVTTAIGNVLTYTCPAGTYGYVTGAYWHANAGTSPTMQFETTVNGVVTHTSSIAQTNIVQPQLVLGPADTISWRVLTAGAGSNIDALIAVENWSGSSSVGADLWIGFGQASANGQGMPVFGGVSPRQFDWDDYGTVIGLDIWAVAAAANTPYAILHGYD